MFAYHAELYCDTCGRAILADLDRPTWDAIKILRTAIADLDARADRGECLNCGAREEDGCYCGMAADRIDPLLTLWDALDHLTFPSDEPDPDSDVLPVYADENYSETDSPSHCANEEHCPNAEHLTRDGRPFVVGALLRERLTSEGLEYVRDAIAERPDDELMRLWADAFDVSINFRVQHASYCGMSDTIADCDTRAEAEDELHAFAERMRAKGYETAEINRSAIEILEPDDCAMVPDECGVVTIVLDVELR